MLESRASLNRSSINPNSLLLHSLRIPPTMSAECESAVPQSLGSQSLHHASSALAGNGNINEKQALSGISYEGRLSLISPYMNFPPPASAQPLTSSFLSSFPHSQLPNFMNSDIRNGFYFGEEHRRNLYNAAARQLVNPNRNNNDSVEGIHVEQPSNPGVPIMSIKQEPNSEPMDEPGTSTSQHSEYKGNYYDPIAMLQSSRQENTLESTPDSKKLMMVQAESPVSELQKEMIPTTPRSQPGTMEEDIYMNDENGSKDPSPYGFPCNDELDPAIMESDPEDSHENSAAMSLLEQSFDGSPVMIEHGENSKSLKCQYCSYSTDSQFHFNSHLNTHFDHKCTKCDFTAHTINLLKEHSQEEHGMSAEEVEEVESIRVPKINAQGKVKKFNCKQCGYVAITKSDFWRHARSHIKSEKLLTCNKCPFVTEYKHHLEYHLRNHVGIKPYQCNKCTYSCVNKSMLNSHMKSHSNVYQYRCSNCTYATKYCHSLKLHLRKYGHTPAMVLNPDGTPNPVPIIDVYGTRRGPKLKKDDNGMPILPPHYQFQAQVIKAHMEVTGTIPPAPTAPPEKTPQSKPGVRQMNLPFPTHLANNPFSMTAGFQSYPSFIPQEFRPMKEQSSQLNEWRDQMQHVEPKTEENLNVSKSPEVTEEPSKCDSCDFATPSKDVLAHHSLLHKNNAESERRKPPPLSPTNVRTPTCNSSQGEVNNSLPSPFSPINGMVHQRMLHQQMMPPNLQEYLARAIMLQGLQNPAALELRHQLQLLAYQTNQENNAQRNESFSNSPSPSKITESTHQQTELALDLSKEQTPPNRLQSVQQPLFNSIASTSSPSSSEVSTPPAKNRRKGRAFKLERIALRLSGSGGEDAETSSHDGDECAKDLESPISKSCIMPPLLPLPEEKDTKWKEAYHCQFCDIAFKDVILYTMHMGYHGYKEAFTCNSCGYKAEDKINFSLHIARAAHN